MKNILVPIDFSPCSDNAMRYALAVAAHSKQSVTALYVVYPNDGVNNSMYDAFFIDNYVQERLEGMKTWVKKFEDYKVPIRLTCEIGMPISTICQKADETDASMIVMGTTGSTGLSVALLGSVSRGVISNSKVPVMVVPEQSTYRENALFALASDLKRPLSKTAIHFLQNVLHIQENGIAVVHVLPEQETHDPHLAQVFSAQMGAVPHDIHYLHNSDIAAAVQVFVESTECQGIVAVAHEHTLIRQLFGSSVSRSLAKHASVPTLVLHD